MKRSWPRCRCIANGLNVARATGAARAGWRQAPRVLLVGVYAVALVSVACSESTSPNGIAGSYTASTFVVTKEGQNPMNVLEAGGALSIEIAADNVTAGSLTIPTSVTNDVALVASMAGTAFQSGDSVHFEQTANSFVRSGYWQVVRPKSLQMNRTVDGTTIIVVLTR